LRSARQGGRLRAERGLAGDGKIYADDWSAFRAWCIEHHAPYLPAPPAMAAAHLAHRAAALGRSELRLILASVAFRHRRAGHRWSSTDPVVATVKRGILSA
jgi:hypothetical protein